jgi:hypothetical protein
MGVGYCLVNYTKKEWLVYLHIGAQKAFELTHNPVSAAITTWYLLQNSGDNISFVSDTYDDWPFPDGSQNDLKDYQEVTDRVVDEMIENGILIDEGRKVFCEDEPDIYIRKLKTVWEPLE